MTTQKFGDRVEELGGLYAQSSSAYADEGIETWMRWMGKGANARSWGSRPTTHLKPRGGRPSRLLLRNACGQAKIRRLRISAAFVFCIAMSENHHVVSVQSAKVKHAHWDTDTVVVCDGSDGDFETRRHYGTAVEF